MKKLIYIIGVIILLSSCIEDIPVGYLSDNIRMREDTVFAVKGIYKVSSAPLIDGSTRPLNFQIVNIRNAATGEKVSSFDQKYKIKVWKSPYNPDEDNTMEKVQAKLDIVDASPILMNTVSGQLALTGATIAIDAGVYILDAKVYNENNSKDLNDFSIIDLKYIPWEVERSFIEYIHGTLGTDAFKLVQDKTLSKDEMDKVKSNTNPNYSVKKVGESSDVKIKLIFLDANGEPFSGNAVAKWPDGSVYKNNWFENSVETNILEDGVEFNFPTVPFPAFTRSKSENRSDISESYYTLHPDYYRLTNEGKEIVETFENKIGEKFTASNLRTKITYQINDYGIWEVRVKFKYALKN